MEVKSSDANLLQLLQGILI